MGSQTAFGPRGSATLLSKATTVSAVLFMLTSLSLSIMATRNAGLGTSILETAPPKSAPAPAPAQPKQSAAPAGEGNTIQVPIPGQSIPAPAQPTPEKAPEKK